MLLIKICRLSTIGLNDYDSVKKSEHITYMRVENCHYYGEGTWCLTYLLWWLELQSVISALLFPIDLIITNLLYHIMNFINLLLYINFIIRRILCNFIMY